MRPNDADRKAKSVDPDQTVRVRSKSSLIWVYTVFPDLSVQKLMIITVFRYISIVIFVSFIILFHLHYLLLFI